MSFIEAVILAVIQGITEFLPISSTGHMIIASTLMGISHNDFTKLFEVVIQLGSIISVLVLYWKRFLQSVNFYLKLFVAFIPSAIIGAIFGKQIDSFLENAVIVGVSLFIGGIIFLYVDKMYKEKDTSEKKIPGYFASLIIGIFQCIALIPGVSRSAATIIGGLSQKLTRKTAAEFSFFLAVPTMFAASAKKMYDYYTSHSNVTFSSHEIQLLVVGNIVAFIVAILAIKTFIAFLTKHGFKIFGYYRIIAALVIFIIILTGYHIKF